MSQSVSLMEQAAGGMIGAPRRLQETGAWRLLQIEFKCLRWTAAGKSAVPRNGGIRKSIAPHRTRKSFLSCQDQASPKFRASHSSHFQRWGCIHRITRSTHGGLVKGAATAGFPEVGLQEEVNNVGEKRSLLPDFINFLNEAWTPFHAVVVAKRLLGEAGFKQISEENEWAVEPGGRYYFTRNMSTIIAFAVGQKYQAGEGFLVVAAHTDSPCLKLKPVSAVSKSGFLNVGVQTYGGGLWYTWFDRDLSVAGRVLLRCKDGGVLHKLVKVERPILRIPTLAIHLDRSVNADGFKPNLETHLSPVLATQVKSALSIPAEEGNGAITSARKNHHSILLEVITIVDVFLPQAHAICTKKVLAGELHCQAEDIADFDLNVCDTQPSCIGGAKNEFIFSGRLDNLASSFCALQALIDACNDPEALVAESGIRMVALFDNEEHMTSRRDCFITFDTSIHNKNVYLGDFSSHRVKCKVGSESAQGAGSPTMFQAMKRITRWLARDVSTEGIVERTIRKSFLVSADMAHALHPNYPDKHEENHQPKLHEGLVIKHNANQRYATDSVTSFLFKEVAQTRGIPTQNFVVRNDMACGSTIGPILASGIGIRTVDCGMPQLSMHSVREMCGTQDVNIAYRHFRAFYELFSSIDKQLNIEN
ncbi:hypothetical protein O6H91_05G096000 [Diphasiastrum complanatum]|uniref:Uncharacterized protein n=2 Tax=Diphasiastrum complanatum TaxID=34168 RepID=A0ACC2DRC1_DIPCM|nr:hypothetical protein O6H91_05G096000 [Diphasiastrum complanatum]KAJ7556740.1 hypothetical protein O6H91_05G096000 [Diphasiastrum complanatum]